MAQSAALQCGARARGMGNVSACLSDVWSMTNNLAGLAEVEHATASASYHAIPSFSPFNRMAAVFALPIASGAGGVSVFRFGDDLYDEQILSLGYANTFGLASLGIKGNYIQYRAEGLETRTAISVSFGGLATLTPQLLFGAYIVNINQPVINETTEERIPTRLLAGVAFKPSGKVIASAEIEKEIQQRPTIKAGLEYEVFRKITFRTGFNLHPERGFTGIGFTLSRFQLDYALQWDHVFGLSHEATVICPLKRE